MCDAGAVAYCDGDDDGVAADLVAELTGVGLACAACACVEVTLQSSNQAVLESPPLSTAFTSSPPLWAVFAGARATFLDLGCIVLHERSGTLLMFCHLGTAICESTAAVVTAC